MSMTTIILLVLALYLLQIFLQEVSGFRFDIRGILGTRDTAPELTKVASRLARAKNNMLEALPFFLGLALLAIVKQGETGAATTGAMTFLVCRVLYVPAYVSAVPYLRSTFWLASMFGLLLMALSLQ